jgi:hypothetical protein
MASQKMCVFRTVATHLYRTQLQADQTDVHRSRQQHLVLVVIAIVPDAVVAAIVVVAAVKIVAIGAIVWHRR